ncbi:transcription initiation factor TFIID subunit 4-like [Daphnia carinata]|uniref:transcription initiation factor TFIID subunit 4-like n=1 Tax=Daphnia carinata TaxID=120202 RepID=UPI0025799C20|nr:transcription initiation factor TFIID subunit 4-like [Daphnia carinata]
MASSFLDDLISNPSADADAVSALVGSLESQLSNANVGASNNTQGGSLAFTTSSVSSVPPPLQPANAPAAATSTATATFAGNGNSLHATTTCAPATSVSVGSALSTSSSTVSSIHLPNTTTVHSILPNGNPSGLVNIQQFTGGGMGLPNGTLTTSSGTVTTTLSGLVIHQQQQKMVASTATSQQGTMIIPTKVNPNVASTAVIGQQQQHQHQQQQHQQTTVLGTNGTVTSMNQTQVLRPATQVVQQQPQQQATVINSAGAGILPAGVQVVNMNAMRPQNVQNMAALNNPAHRALAPRVVLAPQQMVGARPGQMGITLQALQGFQAAGAQGHLLVKTETGQYQLLRVGPGPVAGTTTVGSQVVTSNIPALQNVAQQQQQPQQQAVQQLTTAPNTAPTMNQTVGATYRLQVPVSTTIQPVPATTAAPLAGNVSVTTTSTPASAAAPTSNPASNSGQMTPDTAKVKCKNFLSTLLRLASEQPESVATNVQMLIQGLVDAKVEPEEFTTKLQRELNSSPQPCLIPFLKKSLPYLRHSLATRELHIDGIRPPALSTVSTPQPMIVQQQQPQQQNVVNRVNAGPTQIQTVRPMGGQVRVQAPAMVGASSVVLSSPRLPRPAANKATPKAKQAQQMPKVTATSTTAAVTVASTIMAVSAVKTEPTTTDAPTPLSFTITLPPVGGLTSATTATTAGPTPSVMVPSTSTVLTTSTVTKPVTSAPTMTVGQSGVKGPVVASAGPKDASKEKKAFTFGSSLAGLADNDINDVAAMGGVNLAEESQRILGSTDMIGTQIRSCKDENFLFTGPLQRRIQQIASRNGLGDPSAEVVSLISHATQERLKTILEKLAVIAEHRMEVVKTDARYEVQQDVKGQLKFLEELDKLERRRHSEIQREMLLKAAKSRSKAEDPEQAKLKAKAKEMQRAEMEELRQREANMTALQAIGIRKKPKLDLAGTTGSYNQVPLRPRVKRVNLRDLLFLLKEEKGTVRSPLLYKAYLK